MSSLEASWAASLQSRKEAGLWREHYPLTSPQGPEIIRGCKSFLAFCSNDYLGLADHPDVKRAAVAAIERCGVGSGASHLVVGHHHEHEALEKELASFLNRDRALVFSTGYMANLAAISSLVGKSDLVLEDKLNHASLIDGGLLSGARFQRYLHNDMDSLERYFKRYSKGEGSISAYAKKLLVTDGVFSMDGDVARLIELSSLSKTYDACLMVDDAHGLGVLGPQGQGCVAEAGLGQTEVPVLVGTFGKAFGTAGAFVAGSHTLIDYMTQMARPYIYTTAMPPAIAAATRASLDLIRKADDRRSHLQQLIHCFREGIAHSGLDLLPSRTAIQPIVIGDSHKALALSEFMESLGVLVTAIRPPTVPDNTARLRVTLSAEHSFKHIEQLLSALAQAKKRGLV